MSDQGRPESALIIPSRRTLLGAAGLAKIENYGIGERIARCRKDWGLTQKELTDRLGVTQPVVSDYGNDVIRIAADMVIQLAEILRVSTDELVGFKLSNDAKGIQSRRLNRRLVAIEKLNKRDQEVLLRTIDAFVSKAGQVS